jgi:ribosome biogenesis GTPase
MNTFKYLSLPQLGWRPRLQQQLSFEDMELGLVARVINVQRDTLTALSEKGELQVPIRIFSDHEDPEYRTTVGDWIWIRHDHSEARTLERLTHLKRTAAGSNPKPQSIAANIDTIFLVSSCNHDFKASKLERFLALVMDAHIPAVIVLTKADLTNDADRYYDEAKEIHRDVPVIVIDALSEHIVDEFAPWLSTGQTIAFIGASGVGKSTLTNSILGAEVQTTQGIREDDAKGRHTTTDRSMHLSPTGAWVMDTPGMRALKLPDITEGISELFDDIEQLMQRCKFNNCHHEADAGCAIQSAISNETLPLRRWHSYLKLQREAAYSASNKWQQREKSKQVGKMIKTHLKSIKNVKH